MSSFDYEEVFEQYYQTKYDFNTASLSSDEVISIKQLVKEKRVDYALAPIGSGIFKWISDQRTDIRFELVPFDSDAIDGMLYIPTTGEDRAYIILNSNKPLINQIFTSAHEYYHYIMDYQKCKEKPYICDFSMLKDVNEKCASRFAAELLLPEDALRNEVRKFERVVRNSFADVMNAEDYSPLIICLTVTYQLPLKAVIYRFVEEGYINNADKYIADYDVMKKLLQEITVFKDRIAELYSKENRYVISYDSIYADMEKAYLAGNASREEIVRDTDILGLNVDRIKLFLDREDEQDDDGVLCTLIHAQVRST